MCLILFAYHLSPSYPFILAANRDEFYRRPTAPLDFWDDNPGLLAGRDLQDKGTWMGVTRSGRFAALTNFRAPRLQLENAPSRGHLVSRFLESEVSASEFLKALDSTARLYNPFNLIVSDRISAPDRTWFYSNQGDRPVQLKPGIHGLCNQLLDVPWPKVTRGCRMLTESLGADSLSPDLLLPILQDRSIPPDEALPDTGMGLEWERILSPIFIRSEIYGTRSSTVLLLDAAGSVSVAEWTYPDRSSEPKPIEIQRKEFSLRTP